VELGAAGQSWITGPMALRNVRYEQIIVDGAFKRFRTLFFRFWDGLFVHFRAGASVSRASVSLANEKRMRPFAQKMAVADDQYTVAFQNNNKAYAETATFSSYVEAQSRMNAVVQNDPSLMDEVHVIPTVEVNQNA
jgi:hypothetical protein